MSNILVTGSAGFIGMHLVLNLTKSLSNNVWGIDSLNEYYSKKLKLERLSYCGIDPNKISDELIIKSSSIPNYKFILDDLSDINFLEELMYKNDIDTVIHLAAQAGVRYSIENPQTYIHNNLNCFFNIIESSRKVKIKHFVYASSSSVYGNSKNSKFNETQNVDSPVSLYAATKKCDELIAHSYSEVFKLRTTGLRFFTVYGPWGRPDMAYFSFTEKILNDEVINVYNNGELYRDFTYIDDIVNGIEIILENRINDSKLYEIFNIGNDNPTKLIDFIKIIENKLNKVSKKKYDLMQNGDVYLTCADIDKLKSYGYKPKVSLENGISKFVDWYLIFFSSNKISK